MKERFYQVTRGILFCCLAASLPVMAQDTHPQSNDHPTHEKQAQKPEHRAQRPAANAHPAEHNTNRPQSQRQNENARPMHGENHAQPQPNRGVRPEQNRSSQHRAGMGHPNQGHRPAQWGRPPSHRGSYSFRSNDRARLHSYYMNRMRAINRANRPVFRVGGYFPYVDIGYISPLPADLYGSLPPPPPGYEMGYYDGYVVVYDPVTYFIASVIDLLQ